MDEKIVARFWRKVDRRGPDECWNWQGALTCDGYGIVVPRKGFQLRAHRVAVMLDGRRLRRDLLVLHACGNKQCVNPRHLELGKHRRNTLDWLAAGSPAKTDKTHAKPRWPAPTPEQRFWTKVDKRGSCWLWTAGVNRQRYGQFQLDGRALGAHRYAFFLAHGRWPVPCALHTCDNPTCVNPDHLVEGTRAQNNADMLAKGRQARGAAIVANRRKPTGAKGDRNGARTHPERRYFTRHPERVPRGEGSGMAKLTEAGVHEIMRLSRLQMRNVEIAARVGVSPATVSKVRLGQSWRHVPRLPVSA
jgi:hypothetical protein